jgi:hypothetical protein
VQELKKLSCVRYVFPRLDRHHVRV